MNTQLIGIDIDGTLVDDHNQVSTANKDAIKRAKQAGIKVVLCTGRPLKAISHVLEACDLTDAGDYAITYNGGLIQATDTGEIIQHSTLSQDDVVSLYNLSKTLEMPISLVGMNDVKVLQNHHDRPCLYYTINKWLSHHPFQFDDYTGQQVVNKMVIARPEAEIEEALKRIPEHYFEQFFIVKSLPNLLEFMPKTVNKGAALKLLGQQLGIVPEAMMGIGDMDNDLTMIEIVGKGVVMGQAPDYMKDVADYITKSNNESGVAHAIEQWALSVL
ncbi:Cof-type HAD-IIB family hydrolase [Dolosigranulum savutiense]|uniref:Cof-type HAD-IIB family hydrolase n=1 Tax=Dolosigranulum savutiense TaxID=3110288 RepID=A0AB74U0V2_9LACT